MINANNELKNELAQFLMDFKLFSIYLFYIQVQLFTAMIPSPGPVPAPGQCVLCSLPFTLLQTSRGILIVGQ